MEEQAVLLLGEFLRATTGADDNGEALFVIQGEIGGIQSCISQSLSGRGDG